MSPVPLVLPRYWCSCQWWVRELLMEGCVLGDGPISQDIEEEAVGRKGCKLVWVSVFSLLLFGFFFFLFPRLFPFN